MLMHHMNPQQVFRMALVALSLVAWFALGTGIGDLTHGEIPLPLAFLLALVIQALLAAAAMHIVPRKDNLPQWAIMMVLLVMMLFVSITFSTAFYFKLFSAKNLGEDLMITQADRLITDAKSLRNAYGRLAQQIGELSRFSQEKAELEETRGGSCRINKGGKAGPYTYKRRYQKEVFSSLESEFNRKQSELNGIIDKMDGIRVASREEGVNVLQQLESLKQLSNELKSIYVESLNSGYRELLEKHKQYEMEGFPEGNPEYQLFAGKHNACGDVQTIAKINAILGIRMPAPPQYEVQVVDTEDRAQIIRIVIGSLFGLFGGGNASDNALADTNVFDMKYAAGIAGGVLVEGMILIVGLVVQLGTSRPRFHPPRDRLLKLFGRIYELSHHYTEFPFPKPSTSSLTMGYVASWLHGVLRWAGVEVGEKSYLFIPEDPPGIASIQSRKGQRFVELMHDLRNALADTGSLVSAGGGLHTDFKGVDLDEHKKIFGLNHSDIDVNTPFRVFEIDENLFQLIAEIMPEKDRLDRVFVPLAIDSDTEKCGHYFESIILQLLYHDEALRWEYLQNKLIHKDGAFEVEFYKKCQCDQTCESWLTDELHVVGDSFDVFQRLMGKIGHRVRLTEAQRSNLKSSVGL